MKINKKFLRTYMVVATCAFSAWVLYVGFKLVILTGHFVSSAFHTVINSIPLS